MYVRKRDDVVEVMVFEPVNRLKNGWEYVEGYTLPGGYRSLFSNLGNLFCSGEEEFLRKQIKQQEGGNVYLNAKDYPFDAVESCTHHGMINVGKLLKLKYGVSLDNV